MACMQTTAATAASRGRQQQLPNSSCIGGALGTLTSGTFATTTTIKALTNTFTSFVGVRMAPMMKKMMAVARPIIATMITKR